MRPCTVLSFQLGGFALAFDAGEVTSVIEGREPDGSRPSLDLASHLGLGAGDAGWKTVRLDTGTGVLDVFVPASMALASVGDVQRLPRFLDGLGRETGVAGVGIGGDRLVLLLDGRRLAREAAGEAP